MKVMTKRQRDIIAELESTARHDGLEHHLEAARALADDGIDAATIAGMMRFMFSRAQINALIAEARELKARTPLPALR